MAASRLMLIWTTSRKVMCAFACPQAQRCLHISINVDCCNRVTTKPATFICSKTGVKKSGSCWRGTAMDRSKSLRSGLKTSFWNYMHETAPAHPELFSSCIHYGAYPDLARHGVAADSFHLRTVLAKARFRVCNMELHCSIWCICIFFTGHPAQLDEQSSPNDDAGFCRHCSPRFVSTHRARFVIPAVFCLAL